MAQLSNLIVTGVSRLLSKLYVSDSVTAPTFIGKLQGNADTATKATSADSATAVVDYADTSKNIKIGYSGSGITGDNINFIAGYTGGNGGSNVAKIKDVSKDALKSWLGLGSLAYSSATIPSVGNGTVTVKQNGTSKGTFTMNQSGNTTIELTDNNTTYSNMTAATASAAGKAGLVPAPAAGKQASFLRGDGTWVVPTNTTYSTGTASTTGLTKLYTGTGTATDGTMTQSAITTALNGKAASSHTHDDRYYTESEINTKLGDLSSLSSYGSDVTSILKAIIAKLPETYSGSYSVTPSATTQSLSTSGKVMKDNVSVSAIPYKEESNSSGTTVTIG